MPNLSYKEDRRPESAGCQRHETCHCDRILRRPMPSCGRLSDDDDVRGFQSSKTNPIIYVFHLYPKKNLQQRIQCLGVPSLSAETKYDRWVMHIIYCENNLVIRRHLAVPAINPVRLYVNYGYGYRKCDSNLHYHFRISVSLHLVSGVM